MKGGRGGGREGRREGGWEGRREGGRVGGEEGREEGWREGGIEGYDRMQNNTVNHNHTPIHQILSYTGSQCSSNHKHVTMETTVAENICSNYIVNLTQTITTDVEIHTHAPLYYKAS